MKTLPRNVAKRCHDPRIQLVDVGASGGLPETWAPHREQLRVIGFEPDERAFAELDRRDDRDEKWFNLGLHREVGPVEFFITRKQSCSSCLRPNRELIDRFPDPDRFDVVETVEVQCERLDSVLEGAGLTDVDFLKVDTQGSELAILEGGRDSLSRAIFGVEVEICFLELYQGRPAPGEIDSFLAAKGFALIDLRTVTWKRALGRELGGAKGQLAFADALYFKDARAFGRELATADSFDKLVRAASVCLVYGYLDYALELVASFRAGGRDEPETRELEDYIRSHQSPGQRLPHFPGRNALSQLALRLHELLVPRRYRHSQARLGNRLRTR